MRKLSSSDFDHMVDFFDRMAQTSWLSRVHSDMAERMPAAFKGSIIDVGCGTGRLLHKMIGKFKYGVGIDLSPEMVRAATLLAEQECLLHQLQFKVGDAERLEEADETYDAAVSTCVMFLLPQPENGMREMVRVLKKGGYLMMLNPSTKMSPDRARHLAQEMNLPAHEVEYLDKWSDVATKKHRLHPQKMEQILHSYHLTNIEMIDVLDGLAHITFAQK